MADGSAGAEKARSRGLYEAGEAEQKQRGERCAKRERLS